MKKLLLMLMSVLMLTGILGCSNPGKKDPDEVTVKGEMHDVGRISLLVPEGWTLIDLGSASSEFTCVVVKGTKDDFLKNSQISVIYSLPTEVVVSSAAFAENVIQQPDFDLGGYHWTSWTGSFNDVKSEVAETEGEFGYITFSRMEGMETREQLSLKDAEVQAIIKSITVRPTAEYDWVKLSNGQATVQLKAVDGMVWESVGTMNTNGVEADYQLDRNTVTLTASSGTGAYKVSFRMINEEETEKWADAEVGVKVENGKITGVYNASVTMLETPEEIGGGGEWSDDTDYEAIDKFLVGAWTDNPNSLTMFIQRYEDIEHGYQMTIQAADRTIVAIGHVDMVGNLWYENVSINGAAPIESDGWFMIDGNSLLWGHDEAVGEFANANIFSKAE